MVVGITVILSKSQDWQRWYQLIRTGAVNADIWEYVNPDTTEPILPKLTAPIEPTVSSVKAAATSYADLDENLTLQLRDLKESFKRHYKEYREKKAAIAALVKRIQETVDERNHYLLEDLTTPHEMLVALKERLSPTQKIRERDVAAAYKKLLKPPRDSDLDDWLVDWQVTYTRAKALNLPEVHGDRASIDFLNALESIDAHFAEIQLAEVQKCEDSGEACADVPTLLNRYEVRRRIKNTRHKSSKDQPAFATLRGRSSKTESIDDSNNSSKKDQYHDGKWTNGNRTNNRKPPGPCLCGEDHFYSSCYYIIDSIRPENWHPKRDIQRKVNDAIQHDAKLQQIVRSIKARLVEKSPTESQLPPVAMATTHQIGESHATSHSAVNYRLHDSFILDSASDTHVCNDRDRFIELTEAATDDRLIAGNSAAPILGYGTAVVKARTPDDKNVRILHLQNVAYSPTFHINLISLRKIMQKGFKWAIDDGLIINCSGPICRVTDMFNKWVVEYNPVKVETSNDGLDQPYLEDISHEYVPGKCSTQDVPEFGPKSDDPSAFDEPFSDEAEVPTSQDSDPGLASPIDHANAQDAPKDPTSQDTRSLPPNPSDTQIPTQDNASLVQEGIRMDEVDTQRELDPDQKHTPRSTRPYKERIGGIGNPRNIASGPRTRCPTPQRRETELVTPGNFPAAFSAFIIHTARIHRDELPSPPSNWKELLANGI